MSWELINMEGKEVKEGKGTERRSDNKSKTMEAGNLETWYCMRCTGANLAQIRGRLIGLDTASKEPDRLCTTCENYISALLCATCEVEVIITFDMLSAGWVVCDQCDKSVSIKELLDPSSDDENEQLPLQDNSPAPKSAAKSTVPATSLSSNPAAKTEVRTTSVEEMAKIGKQRREEKMAEIREQMRTEIKIKQARREQGL